MCVVDTRLERGVRLAASWRPHLEQSWNTWAALRASVAPWKSANVGATTSRCVTDLKVLTFWAASDFESTPLVDLPAAVQWLIAQRTGTVSVDTLDRDDLTVVRGVSCHLLKPLQPLYAQL